MASTNTLKKGKVTQIIGPVVDIDFGEGVVLPPIYNAVHIKLGGAGEAAATTITAEVVKHLEPGKVRAISMAPTDGLNRGAEVTDTGIGIEPENLQRIFEAFFQKTPSTLGIGVGLTISKEIVALHEGELWAESDGAGQGSVFKVIFPSYDFAKKNG